jgi:hypothetical protein
VGGACNTHGEVRNAYKIFVGKLEGGDRGSVGWINLAPDTDRWRGFVNTVMNLRLP